MKVELERLLALNNAHATELSWLTSERLAHLVGCAFFLRILGSVDAFLLAFDQAADYDSPNFLLFSARYRRFVYIDRIAVASVARRRGLARQLYGELFNQARAAGHDRIVCEINAAPPNPASAAFHAMLGFEEVGSALLPASAKLVHYLSRTLSP
jgi:predicted GNAT superfamily acetyltransferase